MSIINILVGIITGAISGLGIGGGSLLVLYLTIVMDTSQRTAGGINLLYFIACAPVALIGHAKDKRIEWHSAIICAIAGIITAAITTYLARDIDPSWMHRLFGVLLFYIGIRELRLGFRKNNK